MTQCIAFGNHKGGVAKTTSCLSLGACLVELGSSVLLLDLDPQANLTVSLGIDPRSLRRTVGDALLHNASALSVSRESELLGLDILPANPQLATLDKALYQCRDHQGYLKQALDELDPALYDYVLIDCSPSFGPLTYNALVAADTLIIPTQAEYYAAKSLQHVFSSIDRVRQAGNPALQYRILITMFDRRNGICVRIRDMMRAAYPDLLFDTVIEVDTKLRESPVVGKPITQYYSRGRGAQQYRALAQELISHE